mgnify:CR=1 FL=1
MKDTLDIKLKKILDDNALIWDQKGQDQEISQLKSLIKSTLLDALPKERQAKYKTDGGCIHCGYTKSGCVCEGYNQALSDIKDSLEGI